MPKEREKFLSDEEDKLTSHTRGYGNATKPEDYLKEFRDFIDNNLNEIVALNIVATRPKELTRKALKELKAILDREHFSETMLQTAWKEMTNEDIAADIISFIRQRSIGDALISKDDRIHNAIAKTKATDKDNTKEVWFYDLRTNMPSFGKTNPLKVEHFDGFKAAYTADDRHIVSDERWSCYTYEQISEEGKNHSLDLGLIRDDSVLDYNDLPDPIESGEECIAQLEEAVDLLMSVVKELKSLESTEV